MERKNLTNQIIIGILAGLIAYMIIGSLGLYLLRFSWNDYAIAYKDKSYTLVMLLSRLSVGMIASIIAGISTTKITNDKGKSTWIVGAIVFCVAAYVHFFWVWADYPVWYHFVYLLPIIPTIGLSHYFFCKKK
jgi:hypothetical protein